MKKTILKLVSNACKHAQAVDRQAVSKLASITAGNKSWDIINDSVRRKTTNPYNIERAQASLDDARKQLEHLEATYEFAVETFIE